MKAVAQGADNFLDYIMSSYVPKKFSSHSLERRRDEKYLRQSCGTVLRAYILSELKQIIIGTGFGADGIILLCWCASSVPTYCTN